MEILSKSGNNVSWNFEGKALNPETKSSSSWSTQRGKVCFGDFSDSGFLSEGLFFSVLGFLSELALDLGLVSVLGVLSKRFLDSFKGVALAVLFFAELVLVRSEDFLVMRLSVLVEFVDLEVEFSFLSLVLMVG